MIFIIYFISLKAFKSIITYDPYTFPSIYLSLLNIQSTDLIDLLFFRPLRLGFLMTLPLTIEIYIARFYHVFPISINLSISVF